MREINSSSDNSKAASIVATPSRQCGTAANSGHDMLRDLEWDCPAPPVRTSRDVVTTADALDRPAPYVLQVGLSGQERLEISESIYGPHTRRLFADLRKRYFAPHEPLDVAVLGCGSGAQIQALCDFAGAGGSLWMTDISQAQLDLARQRFVNGTHQTKVSYAVRDAHDIRPPRQFDVVYARFLLVHLNAPQQALRQMAACLRPGGLVVCDEHDVSEIRSCPAGPAPDRFRRLLHDLAAQRGVDFTLGAKLGSLFAESGLSSSDACQWGATLVARDQPAKSLPVLSLIEGRDSYIEGGLASAGEMDALIAAMKAINLDPHTSMSMGSQWQRWSQVPPASSSSGIFPENSLTFTDARGSAETKAFIAEVNATVHTPVGTWAKHTETAMQAEHLLLIQDLRCHPIGYAAITDGYLSFFALLPQHRTRGYGKAALLHLVARFGNELTMHVRGSNTSARQFYDRLQSPTVHVESFPDGHYDDGDARVHYMISQKPKT